MAQLKAQPSIDDARARAHLGIGRRLAALDLVPLLIYRIDSVLAAALPFLAWQLDILSPLWQLLAPSTSQRGFIKRSVELHRFLGTPFAIKTALKILGWPQAEILEGQDKWGGTQYPSNQGWAVVRIRILLATLGAPPGAAAHVARIVEAFNFFKPARAWLDSVWFIFPDIFDPMPGPLIELFNSITHLVHLDTMARLFDSFGFQGFEDAMAATPNYSGRWTYGRGITYANIPVGLTDAFTSEAS